eukprot:gi/632961373/ref/XP_007896721.1/ PREDICTED: IQ motif and SEC7 domain-containing protein 3-like [Callorhinchus milii]
MESLMENPMRAVLYLKELTTIVQNQQTLIQTQRHRIHELERKVEELLEENQSLKDQPVSGGGHHHHHHHHQQQQQQQPDPQHQDRDPNHKHPAISTRAAIICNPENENVLHQFCCPAADAEQKLPSSNHSSRVYGTDGSNPTVPRII